MLLVQFLLHAYYIFHLSPSQSQSVPVNPSQSWSVLVSPGQSWSVLVSPTGSHWISFGKPSLAIFSASPLKLFFSSSVIPSKIFFSAVRQSANQLGVLVLAACPIIPECQKDMVLCDSLSCSCWHCGQIPSLERVYCCPFLRIIDMGPASSRKMRHWKKVKVVRFFDLLRGLNLMVNMRIIYDLRSVLR